MASLSLLIVTTIQSAYGVQPTESHHLSAPDFKSTFCTPGPTLDTLPITPCRCPCYKGLASHLSPPGLAEDIWSLAPSRFCVAPVHQSRPVPLDGSSTSITNSYGAVNLHHP